MEAETFVCPKCFKHFDTERQRRGHIGGKHFRKPLKGKEHGRWKEIAHGTNNGYQQHIRRKETPCDKCSAARAKYQKKYTQARQLKELRGG